MGDVAATVVADRDGFAALAHGWNRLRTRFDAPMQEHAWFDAALTAFDAAPFVLVVGPPEQPRAIAPLARRRGRAQLETIGATLWEPTDFLYLDDDALAELVSAVALTRRPIGLSRLLHDSPVYARIQRVYRDAIVRAKDSAAPVIQLDDSWDEPERHLNSRRRSDLRRARRRAGQEGALSFDLLAPGIHELAPLLAEAIEVEDRSWKRERGTSLARSPRHRRFFELYARSAAAAGTLRLAFARLDGRAVAMQLAVERGGALWLLKIGYDEAFARCSPGQLLIVETLRDAAVRGLRAYEFLGGAEPWTAAWTSDARMCSSLRIYPRRLSSVPALAEDGAELVRRLVRR